MKKFEFFFSKSLTDVVYDKFELNITLGKTFILVKSKWHNNKKISQIIF